jgi:hypothetical protein
MAVSLTERNHAGIPYLESSLPVPMIKGGKGTHNAQANDPTVITY